MFSRYSFSTLTDGAVGKTFFDVQVASNSLQKLNSSYIIQYTLNLPADQSLYKQTYCNTSSRDRIHRLTDNTSVDVLDFDLTKKTNAV